MHEKMQQTLLPSLSLFTSVGTLLCCALPALLVTLGAGAALAGLVSTAPWLVALSKYKVITFSVAAVLLVGAGISRYLARNAACPIEPEAARTCMRMRRIGTWLYWLSVAIYGVGGFFAFIAAELFY